MHRVLASIKSAAIAFSDDECMTRGAALAYYTIFSLPPLLVMVFFVAQRFGASQTDIADMAERQLGVPISSSVSEQGTPGGEQDGASSSAKEGSSPESPGNSTTSGAQEAGSGLGGIAVRAQRQNGSSEFLGPASKAAGIAILIFSATGVFAELQQSLNFAWKVEPDPDQGGWKKFFIKRALSLGMIVVIALLLLISLVLTALMQQIVGAIQGETPQSVGTAVGFVLNESVTLLGATLLFAALFKILPDAEMRWKDLWFGALTTAVLFVMGKSLIGWYLQSSSIGSSWGSAAGSLIALLIWVYYTSLIVLFGAELTQSWIQTQGEGIRPSSGAVRFRNLKEHLRDEGR